jgi:hypothetical protein
MYNSQLLSDNIKLCAKNNGISVKKHFQRFITRNPLPIRQGILLFQERTVSVMRWL